MNIKLLITRIKNSGSVDVNLSQVLYRFGTTVADPEGVKRVFLKPLPARFKIYYENKIIWSQ